MAKSPQIPLLKKRTVTLDTDQIAWLNLTARLEGREFSAQLRKVIDKARGKPAREPMASGD